MSTVPKYRAMRYGITRVRLDDTTHGVQYVQAEQSLQAHPERMTDKFLHWARETPERTFWHGENVCPMAAPATGST